MARTRWARAGTAEGPAIAITFRWPRLCTNSTPAACMRGPPTPRIERPGALALRAAARLAPCRSPEASPVMMRMRADRVDDGISQFQRSRALPPGDQRLGAVADRIDKGLQLELQGL